ncbi:MAG: hypothetical protein R3F62_02450 [Planctomycetota bacterium]
MSRWKIRIFDLGLPMPGEGEGSRYMSFVPLARPPGLLRRIVGWPAFGVRLDQILRLEPLSLP